MRPVPQPLLDAESDSECSLRSIIWMSKLQLFDVVFSSHSIVNLTVTARWTAFHREMRGEEAGQKIVGGRFSNRLQSTTVSPDRIAELLLPYIGPAQDIPSGAQKLVADISIYIDLLIHWNARMNLTAIRDPEQIVTRHFGESLFAALHLFPSGSVDYKTSKDDEAQVSQVERLEGCDGTVATRRKRTTLADLGSGAGFPGIPIKLWAPDISVTLIESNQKKSVFLREVSRALTLTDINIQNARAESMTAASFDVVTLRAVEKFGSILPTAASLVAPKGRLAFLVGSAQVPEAKLALPKLSFDPLIPIPKTLSRCLLIGHCASDRVPE
jgi:16S rRNA (guanine527-N7)-methyltransferase